jgi:HAE1 family hydrophobic/amphiphilic exporter-1
VNRPVVATVLILVLVVVGLYSLPQLGVDRFPNFDIPYVTITTTLPGATPEEMETQVTEEIEKQVNTVSGIDTLSSTSSEGASVVVVSFNLEKNGDVAANEVRSKVDLALPNLPDDANKPVVQKLDAAAGAIMQVTLSAKNAPIRELTEFADKKLRPQLENISGVGEVEIIGGQSRQINVMLDPYALRSYNLTALDVKGALQTQNLQVPGGAMDEGDRRVSVRTQGRVRNVAEMEDLIVRVVGGRPIRIRDIATVEDSQKEAESIANVNGDRAVLLNIRKQSGSNAVAVTDTVKERLKGLQATLPRGYEIRVITDQSSYIKASLDAVKEHLILGAILASIIVLVFLWNWRSALIASLAIPASLVSTFALVKAMGFTMNTVTMLALTLAVGIVIDDAVIVIENIYRFLEERQLTPREAAIEATSEIGLAVMATTFSLMAVFIPIAFMSGIVGRVLNSFGLTMAFAIGVSLLVAFTLAPMLSARWLKAPKDTLRRVAKGEGLRGPVAPAAHRAAHAAQPANGAGQPSSEDERRVSPGLFGSIEKTYLFTLNWALGHRWVIVAVCVGVLFLLGPLGKSMKFNFLPEDDESQFIVSVRAPEGTSLAGTEKTLNSIAKDLRQLPEVRYTMVTVADDRQRSQNVGSVTVQMNAVEDRHSAATQHELMERTRSEILPRYPRDLRCLVATPSVIGGSATADVQYVIVGPDLEKLRTASSHIIAGLKQFPGAVDVDSSLQSGKPEVGMAVDRNAAADLGVSVAGIATSLRVIVAGERVSDFAEGGYQYDINLRALPQYRDREDSLSLFLVPSSNPALGAVPLNQVVTSKLGSGPAEVKRYGRTRQVTISANPATGASEKAIQDKIAELYQKENLGPLYRSDLVGRSRELGRTMTAFMTAMLLAVIFMYLILAAQFESWIYPLVILSVLPLTLPFALASVWALGGSLNIFSMLGILVLFGVVMKNAILQVDHTNGLRENGKPRREAILEACRDRLRPILMTTIAFVAGMIPLVVSRGTGAGTNHAMSSVIIGGQVLSLLLTLIATPVIYSLSDDVIQYSDRRRNRRRPSSEPQAEEPQLVS